MFGAFIMLVPIRVAWRVLFRANGYRRLAVGSLRRDQMTPEAWRRALEDRRSVLRTNWLWYLAPFVLSSYAIALLRPAPRVWPVIVEASVTAFALLLLRALTNRMASLLQKDIDDL